VLGLLDGVAHGLFQVHVLALVHGLEGDRGVPVVRGGDDDGVDVRAVDHLVIVEVAVALVEFLVLVQAPLIDVADGQDLTGIGILADLGKLAAHVGAATTNADHADVDAIIGADDPAGHGLCWTGRQRTTCQADSRAHAGRGLHEVSSIHGILDF
jgi:hypothetical protein